MLHVTADLRDIYMYQDFTIGFQAILVAFLANSCLHKTMLVVLVLVVLATPSPPTPQSRATTHFSTAGHIGNEAFLPHMVSPIHPYVMSNME